MVRPQSETDVADRILAAFSSQIGDARFHLWFPPNARLLWHSNVLTLICRNDHFRDWARDQFGDELLRAVRTVLHHDVELSFLVEPARFDRTPAAPSDEAPNRPQVNLFGEAESPKEKRREAPPARRWKTLAQFVTGAGNRVAAAAVQSVLDEPGLGPNPLVIHGPVGTGKTHLLEAAMAGLKSLASKPLFLTAEEFTHRFVQASRTRKTAGFRRLTRGAGALLLDDLGFLANKRATQEELLHVLDSYIADSKPVLVSLDAHPRLADDLLPELTDRLLGGAAWGLLPPDDETRLAILTAKEPSLPAEVAKHLARNLAGNVRELEGALHSLRHYAKVTGEPLTVAIVRDLLGDLLRHTVRAVSLPDIDAATCKVLKLPAGTLQSKARTHAVTRPRMFAVYLARKHTVATYGEIAKHFGVRQHSTAVAAEKKVRQWTHRHGPNEDPATELLARIERELFR